MAIIQTSDFVGEYQLASDNFSEHEVYIDRYEKFYLVMLLGADLYADFIADLTPTTPQTPQTPIYQSIFDSFDIDYSNCIYSSEGIKQMLVEFIYFHILRDLPNEKRLSGNVRLKSESAEAMPYNGLNLIPAYNQAVENYHNIQWYICENETNYPTYNGRVQAKASNI